MEPEWFDPKDKTPERMDVIIRYKKANELRDAFGYTRKEKGYRAAERRGLYFDIWDSWSVPPSFAYWDGHLAPHGWGGVHFEGNDRKIVAWRYATEYEIKNRKK